MKIFFLSLKVYFLLVIFFKTSLSFAIPRYYYRSDEVATFNQSGLLKDFNLIPEELQRIALAEILTSPDRAKTKDEVGFFIHDRQKILAKYYNSLDTDTKKEVAWYVVEIFLNTENTGVDIIKYFKDITNGDSSKTTEAICSAFNIISNRTGEEFDEERFQSNSDQLEKLFPIILLQPNLLNQNCNIAMADEPAIYRSIQGLIMKASSEMATKLNKQLALNAGLQILVNQVTQLEDSFCTVAQIKDVLSDSLRILAPLKPPVSNWIVYQEARCRLYGQIIKNQSGYEFKMNIGQPGLEKRNFKFITLAEIISQVSATQKESPKAAAPKITLPVDDKASLGCAICNPLSR